ncbi:hypothetical protein PRNP1_000178 [Phytophthora ramorum]
MSQSKKQKVSVYEPPAPAAAAHAPPSHSNCIGRIRATPSNCNGPSIAVSVGPKLPQFKPTDKLVVLDWHHAHGHNQKATAAHFQREPQYSKLNQGTISRWLKAEAKIREAVASASSPKENNTVKCCSHNAATREKCLKHPELEKCLILWLDRLDTAKRARLTGKEIKVTARQIYDELEVLEPDRLELSNGWLNRFQARHELKLHRRDSGNLVGSGEIDIEAERKRIQDDVRVFLDRHGSLNDVWGMEMTTVLLECSPMKAAYAVNEKLVELEQALEVLVLEASPCNLSLNCVSAAEFVHLSLQEAKSNVLTIKELVQLVVCQDEPQELRNALEESLAVKEKILIKEAQTPTSKPSDHLPSPPPNEVVLHAQLTLEQFWTQNQFHLSPAVLQLLQQSRSQLQQQAPTPSSR